MRGQSNGLRGGLRDSAKPAADPSPAWDIRHGRRLTRRDTEGEIFRIKTERQKGNPPKVVHLCQEKQETQLTET